MNGLTFYKDIAIASILAAAVVLHTAAAACGFFGRDSRESKILNTGLTSVNILLHIFLICFMMYRGIKLEEAVLVMLISIAYYTLLCFIFDTVRRSKLKDAYFTGAGDASRECGSHGNAGNAEENNGREGDGR